MKLHRTVKHNPELFNLTPLINVLFLTVAFLTLARTFVLQPGISIALPASSFVLSPQRHPQIVSITSGALPALYFEDKKVELKELETALARAGVKDRALLIRADRTAPYELVSNVMNLGLRLGYSVGIAAAAPQP
ncbi:MAG: biopolymer transporter ExbD [Chthoniobacteraceae bacterium]|nr:biopolymer transporter ExbD [Chthoniobacteraceae bacterium]